jgi:Do/DeqQ family serine protease
MCIGFSQYSYAQQGAALQGAALQGARRNAVVDVVDRCKSAVVNISTETYEKRPANPFMTNPRDPFFEQFFNHFFSPQWESSVPRKSLGSGVIIDQKGHILTNHHVILEASKIHVILVSGKEYEADLIGSDPGSDLAVLKISSKESLRPIPMGSSADLMIGETVIAIGNPFGLSNSVTTGVISALNRSIQVGEQVYQDFIQTDASINPGNSGGPLLNILGELIGINTAIFSEAQGIGFAIPVDRARRIMDALVVYGEVHPAWFGMEVQDLTKGTARYFGNPEQQGVLVTEVQTGSPAHEAGIQAKDILIKADHTPLSSRDGYFDFLQKTTANDRIVFQVLRDGKIREIPLKGVNLPETLVNYYSLKRLGVRIGEGPYSPSLQSGLQGVVIAQVQPNSQAARIGLRPGDILLKLNDRPVPTLKEYQKVFSRLWCQKNITLQILRGRYLYYVTLYLQ